jgi:hypothetical protein
MGRTAAATVVAAATTVVVVATTVVTVVTIVTTVVTVVSIVVTTGAISSSAVASDAIPFAALPLRLGRPPGAAKLADRAARAYTHEYLLLRHTQNENEKPCFKIPATREIRTTLCT